MKDKPGKAIPITAVRSGSAAAELGVLPGDQLVRINGVAPEDPIDYKFYAADDHLRLELRRNGTPLALEGSKDYDADPGMELDWAAVKGIETCYNRCIFCFVDQLPPGLRLSLYVKDDDYRYSVLHGNFVTLTNLSENDFRRITQWHLSPLYISVHTTNPTRRGQMMGNPGAGELLAILQRLQAAGIAMHFQIVLCPGYNDGAELAQTVADLAALWPQALSLGIVPVGLTRYRQDLTPLQPVNPDQARAVVSQVAQWQKEFQAELGYPFVFAADEFYGLAGVPIPNAAAYADFPQLENGIGLVRRLRQEITRQLRRLPEAVAPPKVVTLVTGTGAASYLGEVAVKLNSVPGLRANVVAVENRFFGASITVAGLLTGADILSALEGRVLGDLVLVPGAAVKDDEPIFLDGLRVDELAARLGVKIEIADPLGRGLLRQILTN